LKFDIHFNVDGFLGELWRSSRMEMRKEFPEMGNWEGDEEYFR
jgi:hypothetical protein